MNIADRLKRLRQSLVEKEIDGILVSQPENRYYLSGFDGSSGYLLITAQDTVLATDFRYLEQARMQAPDYQIFKITNNTTEWFPQLVTELNLSRLGFEVGHITFAIHRQLSDILNKAQSRLKLVPIDGLVESLRAIKEPEEIELITKAAEISDKAFEYIEDIAHIGMTEKELAWEIEKFLRENGSQTLPFDIIVASGPNSALPHAKPSQRKIHSGEPVLIDMGARFEGYSSDLSRTICLGNPDDTFKKVYDTVLGAQLVAMAIIKEGMSGGEADSLAKTVIEQAGYGEAFGHGLGHGTGLAPHELPRLSLNSTDILTSGMVFTVEPGIYLSDWGGVRIEDLVVVEDGEIKIISKAKKKTLLEFKMISGSELRKGITIELEDKLYQVVDYQHVKQKRTALAKVKLRDIQAGHTIERTFQSDAKFTRVRLELRGVQYLYNDGNLYYFMDEESFEQMPLNASQLGDAINYLKEGMSLQVSSYKGELVGVELPITVGLQVIDTSPGFKGDTVTAGSKPAILETGITIQVPLFVNRGDIIKVDTRSGSYLERAG